MKWVQMVVYVLLFIAGTVLSSIAFKYAADASGRKSLAYFIFGNLIGVLGPIALTFALRISNPNVTYALCYGTAFAARDSIHVRSPHACSPVHTIDAVPGATSWRSANGSAFATS